jgi:hypothetical protein
MGLAYAYQGVALAINAHVGLDLAHHTEFAKKEKSCA